jgi:predicted dehydrogenase
MPDIELVGFVDLKLEAAETRAAQYGNRNGSGGKALVSSDLESTLKQTQPDIVFDCTLPQAHAQVVTTALAHGCHVLGEKPLADSLDNARRVLDAVERAGKLYAITQQRRYDPNILRLKSLLDSGVLGKLTTLHSDFFIGAHFGDFREQMPHILLVDMAIHTFDAARFLMGTDAVSVYCKEWNPAGSWYAGDASAVAIFEMRNGTVYTYRGSWCAEGLRTTWESEWRALCERGSAQWDGAENIHAQVVKKHGGFIADYDEVVALPVAGDQRLSGHAAVMAEFIACVKNGGMPQTICTDNIKSLAMVFAAVRSAETGMPTKVEY